MALGRWTGLVQDGLGNAVAGASIEVRLEDNGALVPLFSDREGTVGLANPFTAAEATIFFHAAGGAYRVTASKGGLQQVWRYVPVGTAGELDIETLEQRIDDGLNRAVLVGEQDLSPEDQEQVRLNIGAASAQAVGAALDDVVRGDLDQSAKPTAWKKRARDNLGGALGFDQTWQDVTASRAGTTIYQNTTGRPIAVSVLFVQANSSHQLEVSANGSTGWIALGFSSGNSQPYPSGFGIIPPGHYYRLRLVGGGAAIIYSWGELR